METDTNSTSAQPSPPQHDSPTTNQDQKPQTPHKPQQKRAPSNSRGPTPGKYQNGKVCFSAWLPTPFLVRLRRYAANLGLDLISLLMNDYAPRIDSIPLSDEDLAEIELSNKSIKS